MNRNQPVKKRNMPLSMLLLVAQIVVNYRNLLGLFTRIPSLARGGVFGIAYYLINAVTSVAPIIMLVLLFQYAANDKAVAKTISRLCYLLGGAFLLSFALSSYQNFPWLFAEFPNFGHFVAPFVYGLGMLTLGSRLSKDKLQPYFRSYGPVFYALTFILLLYIVMPSFMGISVQLMVSNVTSYALLMLAGFFLPATLLEGGKKSRPASMVSLYVVLFLVALMFLIGGNIGYSSYSDRHAMPDVTAVTCPSCHKQYTDNGNKRSIKRKNMCESCSIGFEATKDALGW